MKKFLLILVLCSCQHQAALVWASPDPGRSIPVNLSRDCGEIYTGIQGFLSLGSWSFVQQGDLGPGSDALLVRKASRSSSVFLTVISSDNPDSEVLEDSGYLAFGRCEDEEGSHTFYQKLGMP